MRIALSQQLRKQVFVRVLELGIYLPIDILVHLVGVWQEHQVRLLHYAVNFLANPVFGGKRKVTQQDCMASLMHPHVHLGGWQPMGLTARSIFVGNLLGDWMLVAVLIPQELLGASRMVQNLVAGYIKPHTYSTTMLILLLTVLVFLEMAMLVTQARNNGSRCALET
ncbi:MAG: hypothetical protein Q8N30_04225 [Methylococcales bacterium]|nr:hypothetical protein [Methylococcales bacterium]